MAVVKDTFTDTAGTAVEAHTGETGATWTEHSLFTAGAAVISNANRLRADAIQTVLYPSGTPTSAEYDVTGEVRRITGLGRVGIFGRLSTTDPTGYQAIYRGGTAWKLERIVAGVVTELGSFTQTFSDNTTHTIRLEIRNATKKVFVNGVERISSTDNTITDTGKAGVNLEGAATSNTTGYHLDSLIVNDPYTDAAGAATGSSSLTATATRERTSAAAVAGSSSLSGSGNRERTSAAAVAGSSSLTGRMVGDLAGQAALVGAGATLAVGVTERRGSATLTGSSSLTVAAHRTRNVAASLVGSSSASAAGVRERRGTANLTAAGVLTANSVRTRDTAADLAAASSLTASGNIGQVWLGAAALVGSSSLVAVAYGPPGTVDRDQVGHLALAAAGRRDPTSPGRILPR